MKLLLALMMSVGCLSMWAGTDYGFYVGDLPVTSENCANITPDALQSGTISYDPETHVLTLDNVTLDCVNYGGGNFLTVEGSYEDPKPVYTLTVKLIGKSIVYSSETPIYVWSSENNGESQPTINLTITSDDGLGILDTYRPNWSEPDEYIVGGMWCLFGVKYFVVDNCVVHGGFMDCGMPGSTCSIINATVQTEGLGFDKVILGEGIDLLSRADYSLIFGPRIDAPETVGTITVSNNVTVTLGDAVDGNTDLTNTVIGNVLFSIDGEQGDYYDSADNSVVLNSTVDESNLESVLETAEPGSNYFAYCFSGLAFKVPAGEGVIGLEATTVGARKLCVKVGSSPAQAFEQTEKGTVNVNYSCDKETWVFVYGVYSYNNAPRFTPMLAANDDPAVRVYSLTVQVEKKPTGVETLNLDSRVKGTRYNLMGQPVDKDYKGIIIEDGVKRIVR